MDEEEKLRTTRGIGSVLGQCPLFQTEGIRYAGSKRTLIPFIYEVIRGLPITRVLDGFSGSTRVSQFFKQAGYAVHANDMAVYASVFGAAYLLNQDREPVGVREKIAYLNALSPLDGFFTEAYGGDEDALGRVVARDGKKKPFLFKNTRKLDAIRPEIDRISEGAIEKDILLTSLMIALDKVENTLGHQVAYLSRWSSRAQRGLCLELPRLISGDRDYRVTQQDVASISDRYDLAYFDPPYNTNNVVTVSTRVRYASYYHFWTTLIKNDNPLLIGAANRREDCSSDRIPGAVSPYEHTRSEVVEEEFVRLFQNVQAPFVLLSYSNKGKIRPARLVELMQVLGVVTVMRVGHQENIQKTLTINNQWLGDCSQNFEYLFLLKKNGF